MRDTRYQDTATISFKCHCSLEMLESVKFENNYDDS